MTRTAQTSTGLDQVLSFLRAPTPQSWFESAPENLELLLIDHANCEKKAAGTALSLMYRYVDRPELLQICSRLAREELRHFEQVHALMRSRQIDYRHISSSRYAAGLRSCVRNSEPERLVDTLLTGAVVEARSCERFYGLSQVLDAELAGFYQKLLASEARHFQQYLDLAALYSREDFSSKLDELLERDAMLVEQCDDEFRFHSGPLLPDEISRSKQAQNTRAGSRQLSV